MDMQLKEIDVTFPESVGGGVAVMRELTVAQEMDAAKEAERNGGTAVAYAHAMARRALVSFNGEVVVWTDGKDLELWESLGPHRRKLVMGAWNRKLQSMPDEELEDFFGSIRVRTPAARGSASSA